MLEPGGIGAAGDVVAGGFSLDGRARNLDLREGELGTFVGLFAEDTIPEDAHDFFVYVDNRPWARIVPGEAFEGDPAGDSDVDIAVLPVRLTDGAPPPLSPDLTGDRLLVEWGASTASDVRAYRVYADNRTGTISYTTPLGTVDRIEVQRLNRATSTSGGGTGTVSTGGTYSGDGVNATWAVEITSAGKFKVDYGAGVVGDEIDIVQGLTVSLDSGVWVWWHDAPATYATGARFEFFVGVATSFLSSPLTAGAWKAAVRAVDAAGNESSSSAEASATLVAELEPPGNPAAAWEDPDVVLSWDQPADGLVSTVAIYSNYDSAVGVLDPYVHEEGPLAVVTASAESYTFEPAAGARGEFLFYLRSRSAGGVEEDNATLVRVTVADTPEATLAAPAVTAVQAIAGGKVVVSYEVDRSSGTPAQVRIYAGESADWSAMVAQETLTFTANGRPVSRNTWESGSSYPGARWFGVRTLDGSGRLSPVSNLVQVTPDNTAPGAPTLRRVVAT